MDAERKEYLKFEPEPVVEVEQEQFTLKVGLFGHTVALIVLCLEEAGDISD